MIFVLDALCGAGKSSAMLVAIKHNLDKRWLYITPFLSEVEERVPDAVPEANFRIPSRDKGSKLEDIKELIKKGENIASTHALFKMLDKQAVDMLLDKGYRIVIDEAVDAISEFREGLNKADIHALLAGDFVKVDKEDRNRILWNEEKYPNHDGKYATVRNVCQNSMLYVYNDTFLMCEYPPNLLNRVGECYVLTYMFGASTMRYWMDINGIEYQVVPHDGVGLRPEKEIKDVIRANLEIVSNRTLDRLQKAQKATAFSKRWFINAKTDTFKSYRAVMRSCMVANKVNGSDIFWTTYKEGKNRLMATGFNYNHLPLNIRATNDHKDKSFCVYAANMFPNVIDGSYIGSLGVEVTEEDMNLFTLSNLIQFMFRGTIRQGKPMKILVLSKRVRQLLEAWLSSDTENLAGSMSYGLLGNYLDDTVETNIEGDRG